MPLPQPPVVWPEFMSATHMNLSPTSASHVQTLTASRLHESASTSKLVSAPATMSSSSSVLRRDVADAGLVRPAALSLTTGEHAPPSPVPSVLSGPHVHGTLAAGAQAGQQRPTSALSLTRSATATLISSLSHHAARPESAASSRAAGVLSANPSVGALPTGLSAPVWEPKQTMHAPLHTGVTLALPIAPQRSPAVFYSGAFHHTRLNPLPSYVTQHPKFDGLTPAQAAQLAVHIKQSATNAIAVPLALAASASAPQLGLASFPGSVRPTTPNRQGAIGPHRTATANRSTTTPPPLAQYDAEGRLLIETRRLQGAPLPSGTGPHAHLVMASQSGMPPAVLVPPAMPPFTATAPLAAAAPRSLSETPIHAVMEHTHAILDHTHIKGHAYTESDPWHKVLSRAAPKAPDSPSVMPPFYNPKPRTTSTKQLSTTATALLNAPGLFSPTAASAGTPVVAVGVGTPTPTSATIDRSRSSKILPQSLQRPLAIARGF